MGEEKNDSAGKDINIDINNEADSSGAVKTMSAADEGSRVGLTKEELMRYANEPFWVRLRNILFVSFWFVWLSILLAAIGYVVNSPSCKASAASTLDTAKQSWDVTANKKIIIIAHYKWKRVMQNFAKIFCCSKNIV